MSNQIKLSPKYGLNPTMPVCFWCGKDRGEIALMGHIGDGRKNEDFEAPMRAVIDYEPCEECKRNMALGFTVMEVTARPNSVTNMEIQKGVYPTGRFVVMRNEAAERVFEGMDISAGKAFMSAEDFTKMFT